MTRVILAPLEPALLLGDAGGLGAVARADLLDRGREMVPHGPLGQGEGGGDVRDGLAARRRGQNLTLAGGQRALAFGQRRGREPRIDDALARDAAADRTP